MNSVVDASTVDLPRLAGVGFAVYVGAQVREGVAVVNYPASAIHLHPLTYLDLAHGDVWDRFQARLNYRLQRALDGLAMIEHRLDAGRR